MVSLEQVRARATVRQVDLEAALRLEGVQVWHRTGLAMVRRQDADYQAANPFPPGVKTRSA